MKKNDFKNPAKDYREVPFWSWNDDLDPDELRRQIGLMDEAGWGGFFMHSRVGLRTPYMGKKWMVCINACVDEAKKRGMNAWLYDEDKWPSGFAGGLAVTKPEHRAQALVCLVDNKPALLDEALAAFTAQRSGGILSDFKSLKDLKTFDGDTQSLVQFYAHRAPLGASWYKGYTYFNPMNPEAVRAFLDSTHEVYARECGSEFGKTIPGIFTDEPAYMNASTPEIGVVDPGELNAVPWVDDLPDRFKVRWGYNLLPKLPCLFFDTGDFASVRYHFWRLVTERFVDAFTKQIYDWCEAHQLKLTGHYLLEDNLWYQARWNGAVMPHYEYEHVPGIDKLARNLYTPLTVKQVDSAACQLGKKRVLCESYGCTGGDFSFRGRKWIGDWLYVLGVNLNNPHLSLYSMRGERKRDYPANIFFPQPWWGENRLVADYFARLSYALSEGKRVVDVMVIHPISSAWTRYRPDSTGAVGFLDESLAKLEKVLLNNQRDFHYGDEMLMEKHGSVESGEDGAVLRIGEMSYRVVIIPPSHTLSCSTAAMLRKFASAGGKILAVPPLPTELEGVAVSDLLPASVQQVSLETLPSALDDVLPFDVRVVGFPTVWVHHRREGNADWYFLCNTSLEEGGTATVELRGEGKLETWDLLNGETTALSAESCSGGVTRIKLDFPPVGSHFIVMQRGEPATIAAVADENPAQAVDLPETWNLELLEPNCLTLDWAAVRTVGGEWSSPMYILDAHKKAANAGMGSTYDLRFTIEVEKAPKGKLYLVMEDPQLYQIKLNDEDISSEDQGYYRDTCFRKIDISGKLVQGVNTIQLTGMFTRDTEIESVYLLGEFGVSTGEGKFEGGASGQVFYRYPAGFRLVELPKIVKSADLTPQGLPFFAGRVRLSTQVHVETVPSDASLELEELRAALAYVRLNGETLGLTAWQPYRISLGGKLKAGENLLEVEMVSTMRNLLGSHHQSGGDPEGVGPEAFRMGPFWTNDYIFVPFGFSKAKLLLK